MCAHERINIFATQNTLTEPNDVELDVEHNSKQNYSANPMLSADESDIRTKVLNDDTSVLASPSVLCGFVRF